MRRLGQVLMGLGAMIGVAAAVWFAVRPPASALPWLFGIGLVKLAVGVGFGVMAAGAVVLRLANRADMRRRLLGTDPELVITADRHEARNLTGRLRR